MRLQSSHCHEDRALDAYFSPPEATVNLLEIEGANPKLIWEPAAGNGALVHPFEAAGPTVIASDIADYGRPGCLTGLDYLSAKAPPDVEEIVTNPPYKFGSSIHREGPDRSSLSRSFAPHQFSRKYSQTKLLSQKSTG